MSIQNAMVRNSYLLDFIFTLHSFFIQYVFIASFFESRNETSAKNFKNTESIPIDINIFTIWSKYSNCEGFT